LGGQNYHRIGTLLPHEGRNRPQICSTIHLWYPKWWK
jgi:hypothetical protein